MKTHLIITRTVALALSLYLCFAMPVNLSTTAHKLSGAEAQAAEARKLWEQAIAAKGGREKLWSVRNLHFSSQAEYTTHTGKRNSIKREGLFVFPDKTWVWQDLRPDVFGLRIEMYNYELKIFYILAPDDPDNSVHRLTYPINWAESGLVNNQLVYFMETKWVKPEPVAVYQDTIQGRAVDVVQTQVFGKRFDFALDRQTRLLVRVSSYDKLITGGEGFTIFNVNLSDYVEVNGIKMPQKTTPDNGAAYSEKIQINVDYNEEIFVRPTTIEAGREAWQPKVKSLPPEMRQEKF